jgi:hypothetical protein
MIKTLGRHRRDRVVAGADLHSDQPTILISYLGRRRPLISCGRDGLERGGPDAFPATDLGVGLAVINTERVQQLPNEPGGPEYLEVVKAAHPMGRLGEPSEVAKAILFLASDEASFITGDSAR